ncbi:hypothetical protein CPB83DRAFT_862297 [Crepidotus variabilis]|uniref:F-box domain-containing protein n=1 Tax=Crepidotus variabilis TaxID=179855 RepID=A0A9P6E7A3_9AGAR|nr:hypothetical protein CPB83DRAFT_862297 [Crepidotus variabilis]
MHRLWETAELIERIFDHLDNGEPPGVNANSSQPALSTLPTLARTCKLFLPQANRIIWRRLPDLQTLLINIIPESLWLDAKADNRLQGATHSRTVTLSSSFGVDDLEKLLERSDLVQEFGTRRLGRINRKFKIVNDGYDRLFSFLPAAQSLLPRLQVVDMSMELFELRGSQARLVLGENLPIERLRIADCTNKERTLMFWTEWISILASANLRNIISFQTSLVVVDTLSYYVPLDIRSLSQLIRPAQLKELDLGSFKLIEYDAIVDLGLIPKLQNLVLNISHFDQFEPPPPPMQQHLIYFSNLKNVTIIADSPRALCDFVSLLILVALESFTIERSERNHSWDVNDIFAVIGQLNPCLQELALRNDEFADAFRRYNANTTDLKYKALEHLNRLGALTSLHIRLGCRVVLEDIDLIKVATFHPRLRSLQLYDREVATTSEITPGGVLAMTSALTNLQDLAVRFNASQDSSFPQAGQIVPHQKLTSWDVCTSNVEESGRLTAFLRTAFPSLEYLDIGWEYVDGLGADVEPVYDFSDQADRAHISSSTWTEIYTLSRLRRHRQRSASH